MDYGSNLALGKASSQSSIGEWSTGRDIESDAALANDGVLEQPDREYGNHTAQERNPWWQVDLGEAFTLTAVRVYNRRTYADRLQRFTILTSLDGKHWETAFRKGDASVFGPQGDGSLMVDLTASPLARWVRIRLDGDQPLSLRECEVFGRRPSIEEEREGRARTKISKIADAEFDKGRTGYRINVGGFEIFADEVRYSPAILGAFGRNDYEGRERDVLKEVIRPSDRILEIGTAVGVVTMTAASAVGAAQVATYEANPVILDDARRNFAHNTLSEIQAFNAVLKNRLSWGGSVEHVDFYISRDFWASRMGAHESDEDIIEVVQVPTLCLEDAIASHRANFLICDIEGGEADLLIEADLSDLNTILIETHYWAIGKARTSALLRKLVSDGFDIDLDWTGHHVTLLRRGLSD